MKPRKWVLVVALILLAVISAYQYGLYKLSKNRNLEDLLIDQVGTVIGGEFDVENIEIGFFSTTLSGLKVAIPFGSVAIEVDKIRIGFSLAKYLISRGDITSSLSSIVLVDPVVNIKIPEKELAPNPSKSLQEPKVRTSYEMPVKSILLRNGTVNLISRWKQKVVSVDKLNGKLLEADEKINFELKGRLASSAKNLTFSGDIEKASGTIHLSSRLSKAKISKKIQFRDLSIYKGALDGVVEFTFTDAPFPDNISANGHVTITSGKGSLEGFDEKLNNLNMSMLFEGNVLAIGKMSCNLLGMDISLKGKTGYSLNQESSFSASIKNIIPERIFRRTKDAQLKLLSGYGTAEVTLHKPIKKDEFDFSLSSTGLKFKDQNFKELKLKAVINSGDFRLKSGVVALDEFECRLKGTLNYMEKPFVYSFDVNASGENEFLVDRIGGSFSSSGSVKGIGENIQSKFIINVDKLEYDSLQLGSVKLNLNYKNNRIDVSSIKTLDDFFNINLSIDSLDSKDPIITSSIYFEEKPMLALIKRQIPAIQSHVYNVKGEMNVSGTIEKPKISTNVSMVGRKFKGHLLLDVEKDGKKWNWNFESDSFFVSDEPLDLISKGSLYGSVLSIKDLRFLEYVSGNGDINLDSTQYVDLSISWDSLSLGKIDKLFLGGDSLVHSGILKGSVRILESASKPSISGHFSMRNGIVAGMDSISTDFVLKGEGDQYTVLPFLLRKRGDIIVSLDTLKFGEKISLGGDFNSVDIKHFVKDATDEELQIRGKVSGSFSNENDDFPIKIILNSDSISVSNWTFKSVNAKSLVTPKNIHIENISGVDDEGVAFQANALVPVSFLSNEELETDTVFVKAEIKGDLLNTIGSHVDNPVGGSGNGDCRIEFFVADDEMVFTEAFAKIDSGFMTVYPFVPDTVKNISFNLSVDQESRMSLDFKGTVNNEPVSIYTSHDVAEGLKPFEFGLLNAGVVEVKTGEKGIPLFLPGFLEEKALADIEFAPKDSLNAFTLSGPVDKFKLSGTWVIRNAEFTFPFVDEEPPPENDPFPFVTWDLDLRIGNRNVTYFYNVGGKKRRVLRFVECDLDPSTTKMGVRGRDKDGTFRLIGSIRSFRGSVFYGKIFDRNFELGCNFVPVKNLTSHGYNNLPIIWGSVEAFSDSSRFDRITLKLLTKDPDTGAMNERGRFNEITFRLSSNFEEVPGESEREFFREAGLNIVTLKGAGGYVSDFGDSYVNKYLLGRIERKIAKKLGLDVISVETSVASNYFNYLADSSFGGFSDQLYYLTFANVGVTIGRYFLRDRIFLKWRTELMPIDLSLVPEHSIGFEYQPVKYLWFDFNYGFHKEDGEVQYDPKVMMQLRMPLDRIKKAFKGNK